MDADGMDTAAPEKVKSEKVKSEKVKSEKVKSEKVKSEKVKSEKVKSEKKESEKKSGKKEEKSPKKGKTQEKSSEVTTAAGDDPQEGTQEFKISGHDGESDLMSRENESPPTRSGEISETPRVLISSMPSSSVLVSSIPPRVISINDSTHDNDSTNDNDSTHDNDSRSSPLLITEDEPSPVLTSGSPTKSAPRSSTRLVIPAIAGILLLAVLVVTRNHKVESKSETVNAPTTTVSATTSATPSPKSPAVMTSTTEGSNRPANPSAPPKAASANGAKHSGPEGILAHYSPTGANIFWKSPRGVSGITGYDIAISSNGVDFKHFATLPPTQHSIAITKVSPSGWVSVKISAVYATGEMVAGKAFGLYGQYA